MKVIGKMINKMGMGLNSGLMALNIKGLMFKGRRRAMEYLDGPMGLIMMESF